MIDVFWNERVKLPEREPSAMRVSGAASQTAASANSVRPGGFWYLASPYSKYPMGIHAAHKKVCEEAARLIRAGVPVYSPIAHSHPIAQAGGLDPLDHDLWLPLDEHMMAAARGLIVLCMEGWWSSRGVAYEVDFFFRRGRTIHYIRPRSDLAKALL